MVLASLFLFLENPGTLIFIGVLLLLFFGGKRIPEMFRGLGQGMKEFKDATRPDQPAPPPYQAPQPGYPPQQGYPQQPGYQPAPPASYDPNAYPPAPQQPGYYPPQQPGYPAAPANPAPAQPTPQNPA